METAPDASQQPKVLRRPDDRHSLPDVLSQGLRARKKMETRLRLLAAARELFGARGFGAVSMAEIGAVAGFSTPTVFNYFPSKQSLLIEFHREDRRQQAKAAKTILEARAGSPIDLICALLRTNVEPIASPQARKLWREIIAATIQLNTRPDDEFARSRKVFEAFLAEALHRCKQGGTLASEFDADTAVRTIFAINRNSLRTLLASPAMTIDACVAQSREQVAQLLMPWVTTSTAPTPRAAKRKRGRAP